MELTVQIIFKSKTKKNTSVKQNSVTVCVFVSVNSRVCRTVNNEARTQMAPQMSSGKCMIYEEGVTVNQTLNQPVNKV